MIVRCGRCRAELEVSGPGEFVCPACGTRNAVRGAAGPGPGADPYGFGASASGLTIPGGMPPTAPPPPQGPAPGVSWATCPACTFRFAMGDVATITCPNCRAELAQGEDGGLVVASS